MPIYRPDGQRPRLPRLGKIGLGVLKEARSGKSYPEEVPYFVLPEFLYDQPAFKDLAREDITELTVRFPYAEPQQNFDPSYLRWDSGHLAIKCDGQRFRHRDRDGVVTQGACQKPDRFTACKCNARAEGLLNVVLQDGPLGLYQLTIGGGERVDLIEAQLGFLCDALMGDLRTVPFLLRRVRQQREYKGDDGRLRTRTGYPVHIIPTLTATQTWALRTPALASAGVELGGSLAPLAQRNDIAPEHAAPDVGATDPTRHDEIEDAEVVPEPAQSPPPAELPRAASAPGEPADPPATSEAVIDLCERAAKALAISPALYRRYVNALYPSGPTFGDLHDQEEAMIQAVRGGKTVIDALKSVISAKVNQALEAKK